MILNMHRRFVHSGLIGAAAALVASLALADSPLADSQEANSVAEWSSKAAAARRASDVSAEVRSLARLLELDPTHPPSHARLADLSGPAPKDPLLDRQAAIERATDHPYDPFALLRGGEVLAHEGRRDEAVELLERSVWLADLDPASALDALLILREISPAWRARRVVPVEVYADTALRSRPGWRREPGSTTP